MVVMDKLIDQSEKAQTAHAVTHAPLLAVTKSAELVSTVWVSGFAPPPMGPTTSSDVLSWLLSSYAAQGINRVLILPYWQLGRKDAILSGLDAKHASVPHSLCQS
jgi:hypothetical protein